MTDDTAEVDGRSRFFSRFSNLATAIGIALAAYVLVLLFFTPRYVLWKGLYIERAQLTPEVRRASFTLLQLKDPFVSIDDSGNNVLRWRLLFPLLGHYLHLPVPLFLAIPQIGCFITLVYIAKLAQRYFPRARDVFFTTALMATTSWFFISTGWLAYEDSWCMLGLLLISFAESRRVLFLTCLLAPFIDERFILAIPLALSVRLVFLQWDKRRDRQPGQQLSQGRDRRRFVVDAGIVLALSAAYLLLRIILLKADSVSTAYVSQRNSELHEHFPLSRYMLGTWMSMRLVWLLVICLIALTFRQRRRVAGLVLLVAVSFSVGTGLVIASDLSRSMCVLLPAGLLGLLLLARDFPRTTTIALPALLMANLALPASNVVTIFAEPINSVLVCIDEYRNPPDIVDPAFYLENGKAALSHSKPAEAVQYLDWSLRLDPESSSALMIRAMAKARLKDFAGAAADEHAAMQLPPIDSNR